jgi:ribosome-associated heat shock protein Hsp15
VLSEVRGPAAVAQGLYRETEDSKQARAKADEERKAMFAAEGAPARRPSKRDRRLIHKFSGG